MTKDEALKQLREVHAVQGRDGCWDIDDYMLGMFNGLELALSIVENRACKYKQRPKSQPEQEPLAWEQFYPDIGKPQIAEALAKEKALQALHDENERLGLYKDAYAEQEPMAWISTGPARMIHWTSDKPAYGDDWVPLYTTPPQRKPLTDEDVERIVREARVGEHGIGYTIARAIEAAHGIKE